MKPEYAEVLRWIADGKEVQIRPSGGKWCVPNELRLMEVVCQNIYDDWLGKEITYEFRLKPEGKGYRVAELSHLAVYAVGNETAESTIESANQFQRWITDRIYYE